ncbi:MAG TPA: sigma-70 family RNA polymerase sigma factor, partial [Fimbriiglobus sp.]|nr:sigma-70 family RNA polymerase sigma factor [Fimbriiglobus sp.]
RANRLTGSATVGPWLYKVAAWTAGNLRRKNARRLARRRELPDAVPDPRPAPELSFDLDDALMSLPERYRAALVLCCLEGLTHREAADRLRCAEGTISSRVSRGLAKLRVRLTGRDPTAALAVAALGLPAAELAAAVVRSAATLQIASLSAAASPAVARLTERVLRMFWVKKATSAGIAALLLLGVAVSITAQDRSPAPAAVAPQPPKKKPKAAVKPVKPAEVPDAERVEAVVVPSAQTRRLAGKSGKPIANVLIGDVEIAGVKFDPTDPTRVLITSLKPGVTEVILTDAGGGTERLVVAVRIGDVIPVAKGETSPFQLPNNVAIKEAVCEREGFVRTAVDPADPTRLLITGLKAGGSELTITGADGRKRVVRVGVKEDKKK